MNDFLRIENRHIGEILEIRRVRDDQGRIILLLEGSVPPRASGPPLHVHLLENEEVTVKAGTLGAQVGTETITLSAGGTATFPAGTAHRWWNAGDVPLVLAGQAVPAADLDRFLQAVFAVLNASSNGRPSIFHLAHVLWRHRGTQTFLKPPPAIQKIVFPVILLIGRILGKYRGSDWPGSPESCPGAPL